MLLWATGATLLEVDERARVVRCVAPSMLLGAADVAGQPLAQLLPGPSAPELLRLVERALSQGAAGQLRATLGLPHGAREVLVDVLPPPRDRSCVGVLLRDAADHASASDPGVYLAALCRPPSEPEMTAATRHVAGAGDRVRGLEDVCWALLNANEFLFQH